MAIDIRNLGTPAAPVKTDSRDVRDSTKTQAPSPRPTQELAASAKPQPAAADSVQITGRARDLQVTAGKLAKEPSVDSEKVEKLRSEIQSGRYTVNSERLAAKLFGFERAVQGRT